MPSLFHYNLSAEKISALQALCHDIGVALYAVSMEQHALPLSVLVENLSKGNVSANETAKSIDSFTDEMLYFIDFSNEQIGAFLRLYREAGIEKVVLKAAQTENNKGWTSIELHAELLEEHNALSNGN